MTLTRRVIRPTVVLSYGLGVDSTAILVRWLADPASRDFDLDQLVVVTAMTGNEWPLTCDLVGQHVLPLLRAHRVRYIQVARRGPKQRDGIDVLDDSRTPRRLVAAGAYTLGEENESAGTIPQSGGSRKCSLKFKGWALDQVIADVTGGATFRHVMGFEANEQGRAGSDAQHNSAVRTADYPLIRWGWDRPTCEAYLRAAFDVDWPKSACVFCPFAFQNAISRERTLARFAADPDSGYQALRMEYVAVALNPRQGLVGGRQLAQLLQRRPELAPVLEHARARMVAERWAVYDVRRVIRAQAGNPALKGSAVRDLRWLATGTQQDMTAELHRLADQHGKQLERAGDHMRVWLRERGATYPTAERHLTIAPAFAQPKTGPGFATAWATQNTDTQVGLDLWTTPDQGAAA